MLMLIIAGGMLLLVIKQEKEKSIQAIGMFSVKVNRFIVISTEREIHC